MDIEAILQHLVSSISTLASASITWAGLRFALSRMNFSIFKLTFKKALNNPNEYDATMCMNQLMIEVNRPNEELIKNIVKGCMNAIQREGENIKKIRALMVVTAYPDT